MIVTCLLLASAVAAPAANTASARAHVKMILKELVMS